MARLTCLILSLAAAVTASAEIYEKGDPIDLGFSVLKALDSVERAAICRENDGLAFRNRIFRLVAQINRCSPEKGRGSFAGMPASLLEGIPRGGELGDDAVYFAVSRLLKLAGTLYDHPEMYAQGGRLEARILRDRGGAPRFCDETKLDGRVRRYYELMELSRRDLGHEVHPGGERPFWNGEATVFLYPPAFDFAARAGADRYRFTVLDDFHDSRTFEAASPKAALTPVWAELPAGFVTVRCEAVGGDGGSLGVTGERRFWKSAAFDPVGYRPAKRTYAEALDLLHGYLLEWPGSAYLLKNGRPDFSDGTNFSSYPAKELTALIRAMVDIAKARPERRERALALAKSAAGYLLSTRPPADSPLAAFPATYAGEGQRAAEFRGQHMLIYAAEAGGAFLELASVTGDAAFREAALRIAASYLRLQGTDGTWYLKMNEKDGSPVSPNRLVPTAVIAFLEKTFAATGDIRYREAADRAFGFVERGPLATWDWEGQFEDTNPQRRPYLNLTEHGPCDTAIYLLERFPGDAVRLAQARELLRFAEDQFVMWRAPCRRDYAGAWNPVYQFFVWHTPTALEQYWCYSPIDASVSKLVRTYLALYAAERCPLDLAKARALGDSLVNEQDASGRIRTYFISEPGDAADPLHGSSRIPRGGDWFNCMYSDAVALGLLLEQSHRGGDRTSLHGGALE